MRTLVKGLEVLSVDECLELLRTHPIHVGRIALAGKSGPEIYPVNYRLDGGTVVFRTDPGSKLAAAGVRERVAFEVDAVDAAWEEGWSVVIHGVLEEIHDLEELDRLRKLPIRPWASGRKAHYLRILPSAITGRRIP